MLFTWLIFFPFQFIIIWYISFLFVYLKKINFRFRRFSSFFWYQNLQIIRSGHLSILAVACLLSNLLCAKSSLLGKCQGSYYSLYMLIANLLMICNLNLLRFSDFMFCSSTPFSNFLESNFDFA